MRRAAAVEAGVMRGAIESARTHLREAARHLRWDGRSDWKLAAKELKVAFRIVRHARAVVAKRARAA